MNFGQIKSQVRYRVGQRSDLTSGDGLTALEWWVNAAERELSHTYRFPNLETTINKSATAGQAFININSADNIYAVLTVYDTTNSTLRTMYAGGYEEFERSRQSTSGTPTKWTRFGNQIFLGPAPPSTTISYRWGVIQNVTEMTDDTDTPTLPIVWHDAIIILATRNAWRAIDEEERALQIEQGELAQFLRRVRSPDAIESHNRRGRGLRAQLNISKHHLGI